MSRPGCYETGEPTARAKWSLDEGRSCGNARTPQQWAALLELHPGCEGCSRAIRAMWVFWGDNDGR